MKISPTFQLRLGHRKMWLINQKLPSISPKMKENPIESTAAQISQAFKYRSRRVRLLLATAALTCATIILSGLWMSASTSPTKSNPVLLTARTSLSFEERVAGQRAIEEVYWRHRTWSADNTSAKPLLSQVLPEVALREKVTEALRISNALDSIWHEKITGERLQAEINRMARSTKQPEVLGELFQALENDPHRIAECLARPLLAARLLRTAYGNSPHAQGGASAEVQGALLAEQPFEAWWRTFRETVPAQVDEPVYSYKAPEAATSGCVDDSWQPTAAIPERAGHTAVWTGSEMLVWGGYEDKNPSISNSGSRYDPATDTWAPISTLGAPEARGQHSGIWTGTKMIVWGGGNFGTDTFLNSGGRYDPATDSWTSTNTTGAPFGRIDHTAVWTGTEMIVWGGQAADCIIDPMHCIDFQLNRGGRYNPATDQWTSMSFLNAPTARSRHTAVWSGSMMVVWGGSDNFFYDGDGGRYNPVTDTWQAVSTTNAPEARDTHRAVWTGTEMIVWGGYAGGYLGDGGRYNPTMDTWTGMTANGAPEGRNNYTAVWTGSEMIIWGGFGSQVLNNGGRYTPQTDSWQAVSDVGTPGPRDNHTAVWTGSEMIVWGGFLISSGLNTGGRYNPATNSWLPTSTEGAPDGRTQHTAVWTGAEMIVWGGCGANACGFSFPNPSGPPSGSGGKYDPATDNWTPTSLLNSPEGRKDHTAVWTGSEMIVWGGSGSAGLVNTGGRYNPASDSWVATSETGAPAARGLFTAVWAGSEMIVWGGYVCANPPACDNAVYVNSGGRYKPATDSWLPTELATAPSGRAVPVAVWTGSEMIVWGGQGCSNPPTCDNVALLNTGGRYDPVTDTWEPTSLSGAADPRYFFSAVWTGREMIVWGGGDYPYFNTGGRYNPVADAWSPTSTSGAPVARSTHTAVWSGEEMIIWGGYDINLFGINTGGRYNPSTDAWRATTTAGAPYGRDSHTAVWTGTEMIVWGGRGFYPTATGGRYCAAVSVPPVQLASVVSRKVHGSAGTFDINLPLAGNPGIECRTGGASGDYTIVFSFANTLGNVSSAGVTAGTGTVESSAIGADPHQYIVNLKAVTNAQVITVTLANVNDSAGNYSSSVQGNMAVLAGDTTANGSVNSSDISQTKSQSGNAVTASNFRTDVTVNGFINSSDISLVKSKSGTALP